MLIIMHPFVMVQAVGTDISIRSSITEQTMVEETNNVDGHQEDAVIGQIQKIPPSEIDHIVDLSLSSGMTYLISTILFLVQMDCLNEKRKRLYCSIYLHFGCCTKALYLQRLQNWCGSLYVVFLSIEHRIVAETNFK